MTARARLANGVVLFLLFTASSAQNPGEEVSTPYLTVFTHLRYLQHDNYRPSLAAKTIHAANPAEAEELAIKLKQFLDAKGLYVDTEVIPKDPNHTDAGTSLHRYTLFHDYPDIYVEKTGGRWLYSRRTADAIPALHKSVFPFGTDFLTGIFPGYGHQVVLGLEVWQYAGMLLLVVCCVLLHKILSLLLRTLILRTTRRFYEEEDNPGKALYAAKPLSLLVITVILAVTVPVLQLPVTASKYVVILIHALTPLFGTIFAYRLIDFIGLHFERLAARTENTLDDQLIPLVKKSLKIFFILAGSLLVLQQLDFNVTAILAGLSIGGLAFALAAQDTIKNLFGSLMIFLDRPFQVGDWIKSGDIDGIVEEVGFRSTRVRTFANSVVYVPNGKITDTTVDNMGRRIYRRFRTTLAVTYDTPPALIEAFVDGLRQIVAAHPKTRKDYYEIHLNDFGDSSLNILFYIFFDVPAWPDELRCRHEIILAIIRLAEELGVQFAFPTRTLHVENFPEKKTASPAYETDMAKVKEKVTAFLERFRSGHKT